MVASPFYRQKAKPKAANCLPMDTPVYLLGTSENSERENYCYKEKKEKKKRKCSILIGPNIWGQPSRDPSGSV